MVFTDGKADDKEDLTNQAELLKKEVNEVFAFGIGDPSPDCSTTNCLDIDELHVSFIKIKSI